MSANQELTDTEKLILAREIAADAYEPSKVRDAIDILQVPREAFIAGWDAAMERRQITNPNSSDDSDDVVGVTLPRPTRWKDFVEELRIEPI